MEEGNIESAQEMLDQKMEALEAVANEGDYQHIELRLVDNDGNVKIKGSMSVANMMALEQHGGTDKGEAVKMFYFALEDDLKNKKDGE